MASTTASWNSFSSMSHLLPTTTTRSTTRWPPRPSATPDCPTASRTTFLNRNTSTLALDALRGEMRTSSQVPLEVRRLRRAALTVFEAQLFGAVVEVDHLGVDVLEGLLVDLVELVGVLVGVLPAELGEVEEDVVEDGGDLLLLGDEVVAEVREVAVLEVGGLDEFGQDDGDLLAGEVLVLLVDEPADEFLLVLVEDEVVEHEVVQRLVDLREEALHFLPRRREVLVDHLLQVGALLVVGVYVLAHDVPDLLDRQHVVRALVLLVVVYAPLHLADRGFVRARQTASQLHHAVPMDMAKYFLVLGVSEDHMRLFITNLNRMAAHQREEREGEREGEGEGEREGERRIGDFLLGKTIGQGTFNKVKIGRHVHSNEQVAIKLIDKQKINSEADRRRLAKELKILRKVRHPNIIQLYEILEDSRYYYVATEYASRGELFEHIVRNEKLTEFEASKILQQMVNAIEYLHELGVVHRDLKPENILLDYKYNVKIIDFGLSNIYTRGDSLTTACGSPCYAAPEMLSGKSYNPLKIDIWSLGIILYAMCFGFLPFDHADSAQLYRLIKEGKYDLPGHASENLVDMLSKILEVDPSRRATLEDIRRHEFCRFSPSPQVSGIIQGLSSFPFQDHIERLIRQLKMESSQLREDIQNNKHNNLTSTYYLLLQQWLRQRNESILSYYVSKDHLINRYKLIEKVKENYDRRLIDRQEEIQQRKASHNKKGKSAERNTQPDRFQSHTVNHSKNLFVSPERRKRKAAHPSSGKRRSNTRKQLKRS